MATKARKKKNKKMASRKAVPKRAAKPAVRRKRPRRKPETLRLRSLRAGFTVGDLEKTISFYTGALGFMVGERWTDDAGQLRGVMIKAGSCEIGLSQDDWSKGRDRKKGEGVRIWCETIMDVDALAARVKAAGFRVAEGPKDEPWGARTFSLDDPDGYHLTIARKK